MNNPIINEIREARAALAEEHGYNLKRINEWARKQTEARRQQIKPAAEKRTQATGVSLMPDPVRQNSADAG